MSTREVTGRLREKVWNGSIPLEIRLDRNDCRTYDESDPYLIQFPRLSYLALHIHTLHAFFLPSLIYSDLPPSSLWLSHEDVPLKWHFPLGLLYDLYSGAEPAYPFATDAPSAPKHDISSSHIQTSAEDENVKIQPPLPWRLTIHFSTSPSPPLLSLTSTPSAPHATMHDLFVHAVKEADYLRTGTGKTVMFLSKEDSTALWDAVVAHDFGKFNTVNQKLLNPQGVGLRHLPVRLYLPHRGEGEEEVGRVRVVQGLVGVSVVGSRQPQTIGTALNQILPSLFPSRRSPLLAQAVLHGAVLPLSASVEELIRTAAYMDGWLHIAIVMMG